MGARAGDWNPGGLWQLPEMMGVGFRSPYLSSKPVTPTPIIAGTALYAAIPHVGVEIDLSSLQT